MKHPSKEIQESIDYAVDKGWRLKASGKSSHAFGRLYCPEQTREGCIICLEYAKKCGQPCPAN